MAERGQWVWTGMSGRMQAGRPVYNPATHALTKYQPPNFAVRADKSERYKQDSRHNADNFE